MTIRPEHNERIRIGQVEPEFPEPLERLGHRGLWIGNEAMDDLLAIDIGLVLDVAAKGIPDRISEKLSTVTTSSSAPSDDQSATNGMRHLPPNRPISQVKSR